MGAFIDATCPKCHRKFGWSGSMRDRPPCPSCGHRPEQAELDRTEAEMEAMKQQLLAAQDNAWRKHRLAAKLNLYEAAQRIGTTASILSRIERGATEPTTETARKMAEVYGVQNG